MARSDWYLRFWLAGLVALGVPLLVVLVRGRPLITGRPLLSSLIFALVVVWGIGLPALYRASKH
jgi:hypothetical protein